MILPKLSTRDLILTFTLFFVIQFVIFLTAIVTSESSIIFLSVEDQILSASNGFELVEENEDPVGIVWNNVSEWYAVLDNTDNIIYMYNIDGLPLTDENISVADIDWHGINFYNNHYQLSNDLIPTPIAYKLDGTTYEYYVDPGGWHDWVLLPWW